MLGAGWRVTGALAAARLGDLDRARALSDEDLRLGRRSGSRRAVGTALRARGLVEGGRRGPGPAGRGCRDPRAVAVGPRARARPLRPGRRPARDPLRRALDIADGVGATLLAARARDELVASGAKPRRAALSGARALTPGEPRVAKLAADGLTNRQIAEGLFVTSKTVDWHLRHTFQKLGISSRRDLGAALGTELAA